MSQLGKEGVFKRAFLEEYIEGREFNISLIATEEGPKVLPAAEMLYLDYPGGKPRILNFASKWDPDSFEYHKTVRTFELPAGDSQLVQKMSEISLRCWKLFDINGYMRVDFRVDEQHQPWVLEVNANPCLSPDAGFVAACGEGGLNYTDMIHKIISAAR
jgi:D-alanine-D-alanine ligase